MADAADRVRITQVATVFVPVADQDRALDFYLDELGFEKRSDFAYGDGIRWVEVAPRDSTIALALVPADEGEAENRDATHCALTSDDIEADHATLRRKGVDVDPAIAQAGASRPGLISTDPTIADPVPPQFFFRDPDGNRFLVVGPPG